MALPTTEDYPQLIQEGYRFIGWSEDGRNIQAPTDIWAQYEVIDPNAEKLTVEFYDINNQLIESVLVDRRKRCNLSCPQRGGDGSVRILIYRMASRHKTILRRIPKPMPSTLLWARQSML